MACTFSKLLRNTMIPWEYISSIGKHRLTCYMFRDFLGKTTYIGPPDRSGCGRRGGIGNTPDRNHSGPVLLSPPYIRESHNTQYTRQPTILERKTQLHLSKLRPSWGLQFKPHCIISDLAQRLDIGSTKTRSIVDTNREVGQFGRVRRSGSLKPRVV